MARGPQSSPEGRRPLIFLARFGGLLVLFYFALAARPVNDAVVVPFTAGIARVSGALLGALGEPVQVEGTQIRSPAFAVEIENGCNGLETVLLYVSAVLAFPATWKRRLAGLALGFVAIELFNLVRVATLFWIGAHRPNLFGASHTVVWQTLVVLFGVLLFLAWAARTREGQPTPAGSPASE
jgi:exosortase H (IPTLxxWG-CTERM-specific)